MTAAVRDSLIERLPPDVVVGGGSRWSRYRQYPVFGARWLAGRTLLFAVAIGAFALVSGLGVGFASGDYMTGALVGLHTFVAFMLMATAGPALATWVRHRHWALRHERVGVIVAVLLGLAASFAADHWASSYVEARVENALASRPTARPGISVPGSTRASAPDVRAVRQRMQAAPPVERTAAMVVNIGVLMVVYGMFGGGLSLRAYFSEQRRRRDSLRERELERLRDTKRLAEMRLGVLQAQVEPHFLFNTLAAVRALLRDKPGQAEATLDALVSYLRASIPRMRDDATALDSTLGDQLELCAHYLDVMRLRSGGRLTYRVDVDHALQAMPFPPLLLITLVENAVKHGVEPRPGAGHVVLRATCGDGRLRVDVVDDGAGLQPGLHSGGLGLANVREQLRVRYGDSAALRLQTPVAGGTCASIDIPAACP